MNLTALANEIVAKLAGTGLRAFPYPVGKLPLPGAVVGLPDPVNYSVTYGGQVTLQLSLWVMVARTDNRSSILELLPFMNDTGASSVVAALNSGVANEYVQCNELTVVRAQETGAYTYNDVATYGTEFIVEVS